MTTVQHTRWAKSLAADIAFAEQILIMRGELSPLFLIEAGGGVKSFVECKFPDTGEMRRLLRLIQLLAIAVDAVSITAITQDSEVLTVAIVYRVSGRVHATQAVHPIERNEHGQVTGLGRYNGDGDVPMQSRLTYLLPSARPGPEQRAHAKATFDDLPFLVRSTYAPKPLAAHLDLRVPPKDQTIMRTPLLAAVAVAGMSLPIAAQALPTCQYYMMLYSGGKVDKSLNYAAEVVMDLDANRVALGRHPIGFHPTEAVKQAWYRLCSSNPGRSRSIQPS
jgi:hypothetical protein